MIQQTEVEEIDNPLQIIHSNEAESNGTMTRKWNVALFLKMSSGYDRGVLRGIVAFARDNPDWHLILEEGHGHHLPGKRESKYDGLIVDFDDPKIAHSVKAIDQPVIAVGSGGGAYDPSSGIPYVVSNHEHIARSAAEHLLDRGLKHFAYCGYPANRANLWVAKRAAGFAARLAESGRSCETFHGRYTSARNWERMQQELAAWLCNLPKPVGVLACYDWRARHVLDACHAAGLRVPDDVALIGVDNDELLCSLTNPPLSSVEQDCFGVGYYAAELLEKMMSGHRPSETLHLIPPVGVVARQSTRILAVDEPALAEALRLVRDGACKGMTSARVAEEVGWSRTTLDLRFKALLGRTADQELRRVRMDHARHLLAHSQMPLLEVARAAGLADAEYLSALIRKHHQMTPSQYRQLQQKHAAPVPRTPAGH